MNPGTLIKIPNDKKNNNKNHHKPVAKKLDDKMIIAKLKNLIKEKNWQACAYVEKHPDIKNFFQVLFLGEDQVLNKKPLCLFSVTCVIGRSKSHYDFYSKKSGRLFTADIDPESFFWGIKTLEGVDV